MLLSEAYDIYKKDRIEMRGQSPRTEEMHAMSRKLALAALGDISVSDLTIGSVRRFSDYLRKGRGQNTVRGYMVRFRAVVGYLNILGIPTIRAELITLPKRESVVPVFLTESEVSAMVACAYSVRNAFVISLLYSSGIRLSEMISLNRGQIYNRSFTVIGKGNKPRLCFIDDRTEQLMEVYLSSRTDNCDALVVSTENKKRMTATNVQLLVRNSASRAGIIKKVTPHTLRHSFATNFLRNNGNMRYLSALLGHASMDTTMMYAHVVDCDLRNQYEQYHSC